MATQYCIEDFSDLNASRDFSGSTDNHKACNNKINIENILIDHSSCGHFQSQWSVTWLKILTGRRYTSWLLTSVAEELNLGLWGKHLLMAVSTRSPVSNQSVALPSPNKQLFFYASLALPFNFIALQFSTAQ